MSMNGRKKINKRHPDYQKYIKECEELRDICIKQEEAVEEAGRAEYPDWCGKDSPWGSKEREIAKKFSRELKELQKKYAHLFLEGPNDGD